MSQFTFHPKKTGLFERTEIFFLRPGLLPVGGMIVARDVIHPLLDQLLRRDPRLYLNRDRKMSRLQAFLVLYECSFKKPRVSSLLSASSANLCYSKLLAKSTKSRYMKKTRFFHPATFFFRPDLYIYIYQLGKKSTSVRGRRTITLRTMRQFTSVPSGNRLSDSSNEKRRIIVVQRRTRDRPKCTVNVQLSTLSDCH